MKVENVSKSRVKVLFDVTAADFDAALDAAYDKVSKNITMPGFRKGHAPKAKFLKTYGYESLYNDALDVIFNQKAAEIYGDKDLSAKMLGQFEPNIETKDFGKGKDFTVSLSFDVIPEFDLPAYKGVEVAKPNYAATDDEVEAAVNEVLKAHSTVNEKKEQVVANGDIAKFDFVGKVDGVEFNGGSAKDYELEIGSNQFIPGFESQMVGMKKDEVKDITVTFPENYGQADLAGKPAVFTITLHEVKEQVLPTLNDEFVASLGVEAKTVADFKAAKKNEIETRKATSEKDKEVDSIINTILDATEVDIPESMINERVNQMKSQYEAQAKMYNIPFETFLSFMGTTPEQFEDITKREAVKSAKFNLVASKIMEVEKIEPSKEELEERAAKDVEASKMTKEELLQQNVAKYYNELAYNKLIDLLVSNAKEVEGEVKAPAKKAAKAEASDDLSSKSVAELKEMAKAKGISGISTMKKADLIAALSK